MERIKNVDLDNVASAFNYHANAAMMYWGHDKWGYYYDLYPGKSKYPERSRYMTKRELYDTIKTMAHTVYMVRIGEIQPLSTMD